MDEYNRGRIQALREKALEPVMDFDRFYLYFYRRYAENASLGRVECRYADALAYAFARIPTPIGEGELIVGKADAPLSGAEKAEWQDLKSRVAEKQIHEAGQDSHMAVDYETLLREGLSGLIRRIDGALAEAGEEKAPFYRACRQCLEAVGEYAGRYAGAAEGLAHSCADERRKEELERIARICRAVPWNPAESFYEAVQSVYFVTYCLTFAPFRFFAFQQFQLGRPDRYLYPYYRQDIERGELTPAFAQVLLDCLGIQLNNIVPHGLSSGYMVGGRQADGRVVSNELTRMGMQVVDDVRLVYPAVGLCCCKDTPEQDLALACRILSHGCSHPAIFNDDVISEGLKGYGVPEGEAHDYIHSTCVEITPIGASNVWVASPYTNLVQILLDLMDGGYASFEELLGAYLGRLGESIRENFEAQNGYRKQRAGEACNPLLSCFVKDCLARGVDIEKGGARYNWIMPSFVGMANAVDCLYVLRKFVFEEKRLTLAQLKTVLDQDFEGNEPLRQRLLHGYAKYGNDVDEVDQYAAVIVNFLVRECRKYTPALPGARLIPSVFCWIIHERFGRETGATPDGRKAGFPLGDGSGPCQGREMKGPTASILSSTKWPHKELIGGVAVNMKFSKKMFGESSLQAMMGLIRTYLQRGGFELQINVTDRETLLRARENPEAYRDLLVRIGGYSDYFVKLSPNMQREVLLRTEHEV